jgi:hypothetical protein
MKKIEMPHETREDRNATWAALWEVRLEITRINQAANETIFNPAATAALQGVLDQWGDGAYEEMSDYLDGLNSKWLDLSATTAMKIVGRRRRGGNKKEN